MDRQTDLFVQFVVYTVTTLEIINEGIIYIMGITDLYFSAKIFSLYSKTSTIIRDMTIFQKIKYLEKEYTFQLCIKVLYGLAVDLGLPASRYSLQVIHICCISDLSKCRLYHDFPSMGYKDLYSVLQPTC